MNIRIDPTTAIVRFYCDPIDMNAALSDMKKPYYKTVTLIFLDTGEVRVTDCVKSPTYKELKGLFNKLSALGYKKIAWRHGTKEHVVML